MSRKLVIVVAALALFASAACAKKTAPNTDRGIAVSGTGTAVVRYEGAVVTIMGLGQSKDRYEGSREAERALAPMVDAARRVARTAKVKVETPAPRPYSGSGIWQRALVTLASERQIEAVLRAVFEACENKRTCAWALQLVPTDPESATTDARRNAMADARKRASELAREAGVRVGAPIGIREVEATIPGLEPIEYQAFSAGGLLAYEALLANRRSATPKPQPLVRLEVRFEINR